MTLLLENTVLKLLHQFGGISIFFAKVMKTFLTTRGNFRPIIAQVACVSFRSFATIAFAGIFVGAILVLQFNLILAEYDAQSFLGGLNTSTVVREVGPLIISFLLAGKIGAYTAAELGTMRVTEQIDAIECLGTNPIQYLVVPRMIGIVISSLILLILSLMISIAGAMVVASTLCDINYLEFISSIPRFTSIWTVLGGMFKSMIYGTIVAAVACYQGFTATGGARGVGRAVTLAAVYTNLYILLGNYILRCFLDFCVQVVEMAGGMA